MRPLSAVLPSRSALRRLLGAVALAALGAALASCALSRPAPAKRAFLLEPTAPPAAAAPKAVTVRVGVVNVAAPFRGKAFVYREGELKYDVDYYDEFLVAPTAMLSETTARALASAGLFRRVGPPGAADETDFVLDGFVSELYGDMRDPARPAAVLTATFYVSPATAGAPGVIWSREYRQRVPSSGPGPASLAQAWNAALSAVYADLARDLGAADLAVR